MIGGKLVILDLEALNDLLWIEERVYLDSLGHVTIASR